jgi:hypothetical protein
MSDCIVKGKNPSIYRRVHLGNNIFSSAHRLAWEKANGPVPKGMDVCHSCNVKGCENPEHLYLGTRSENIAHAHRDGLCNPAKGGRQGNAILNDMKVIAIRGSSLPRQKLAEIYGVSLSTIDSIINKKSWRHI